jgi:hypothetical protein
MEPDRDLDDKLTTDGGAMDPGYDAWFRVKVETALAQSRDRGAMIPIERVLRDFSA